MYDIIIRNKNTIAFMHYKFNEKKSHEGKLINKIHIQKSSFMLRDV